MMKVTKKKPAAGSVRGPSQSERAVPLQKKKKKGKKQRKLGEAALMTTPRVASRLQEIITLTEQEAALREEKVRKIKTQLARGTYQVNSEEVAKAIVRSEVSRLLSEGRGGKKS
jgi:flagellar biosynthesis anti-sigma factor FlgM